MRGEVFYLDSSAIVKRYIEEPGSPTIRKLYLKSYSGEAVLAQSIWNIGEVLGAFDRARNLGRISEDQYRVARKRFLLETRRMMRLGSMLIVPIRTGILRESWKLVEKHHIYAADALQIASARHANSTRFLTRDKHLHRVALKENMDSTLLE
jgi:predicted nucleic acid-binding protein